MAKLKKIDWAKVDAQMKQAVVKDTATSTIHPRIRKAMDDYPVWRFYTDSEMHLCVFRILGVYPPADMETNPDFKVKLIAASLPPGRHEDLRLDALPQDHFEMIEEWSPHHVNMIRGHKKGSYFAEPVGFYHIQHDLDKLTLETYDEENEEIKE